jgi:hypothetical protein
MPGEVQGCVGCHEHRLSVSPAQRVALTRPAPVPLRPPEWGLRGFDYSALVQPVLDRHCTGCHSGPTPPAKVDLAADKTDFFNVSYETLARGRTGDHEVQWGNPYVNWIPTYNGLEANILQVTPKTWGSPRSKLADVVLAGCPDRQGKRRVQLDDWEVRRILAWIDLNVPYYGTSETAYPELPGCRRMYPAELDKVLCDVAARRCAGCHQGGKIPRPIWTRITNPQMNGFLLAPLARAAGGSQACGKAVFRDRSDPDYRAILKTFEPITAMLRDRPRDDMPGAKPALCVNRSCE